ncbi:MAG: 5'-nucleotidase C-terminal domain-containing protein [Bacteroidetes bacterium]|nr:5'-nucleotidase C-terminal domain-containing protein [Bacteroidota bacterium]
MRFHSFILIAILTVLIGCKGNYVPASVTYSSSEVQMTKADSGMIAFLKSYKDSLDKTMSRVVVMLENDLEKKQPQGSLGDMMADAMLAQAEKIYGIPLQAAVMNYGGIRLPVVKAGAFTLGKLYEVHPFDNLLVVMKLKGDVLLKLLQHTALKGGWPVAGISMVIRNRKAEDVRIGGALIREDEYYLVALSDYLATGGDEMGMLKGLPYQNKNYLIRDAIHDYLRDFSVKGIAYPSNKETRVVYAE